MVADIKHHHESENPEQIEAFLIDFKNAALEQKQVMLQQLKAHSAKANLTKKERKQLQKLYRTELVKRSHLYRIAAAWIMTVPTAGLLSAI